LTVDLGDILQFRNRYPGEIPLDVDPEPTCGAWKESSRDHAGEPPTASATSFFAQPFRNEQADLPLGKSLSMTDSASKSPWECLLAATLSPQACTTWGKRIRFPGRASPNQL
jgi:hypothetical protein